MSAEAAQQQEEFLRLRAKLETAERLWLAGAPTFTVEESRKRLEAILKRDK